MAYLFRSTRRQIRNAEVMVFRSPRIVHSDRS
ncbi:hypothetical protein [Aporhodopirellula aestuarii]|nr:hypothetical protein [Aporhodopirellula aestuarii]